MNIYIFIVWKAGPSEIHKLQRRQIDGGPGECRMQNAHRIKFYETP